MEERFSTVVDLPDGERVELLGYADRVELDADGRVVVVDLKTGRTPPTGAAVTVNLQLALYQYAVDSGAIDGLVGRPVRQRRRGAGAARQPRRRRSRPSSSRSTRRPTSAARDRSAAARRGGRACCAPRTFPAVPGSTATPASSWRCARSRAPGRCSRVTQPRTIAHPEDLQRVMRSRLPAERRAVGRDHRTAGAGRRVAGAGSGKTTLMAARVVYLVVTGQVRPEEVLGLTFTTKAAAELRERIRTALERRRRPAADRAGRGEEVARADRRHLQRVRRRAAHRPRPPDRPRARHPGHHRRLPLPARRACRRPAHGAVRHLSRPPGDRDPEPPRAGVGDERAPRRAPSVRARRRRGPEGVRASDRRRARRQGPEDLPRALEKAIFALDRRAELLDLVAAYRRLKSDLGLMDFSDQVALGARLASEQPDVGALERARFKVVLLDEYQDTSVAQAVMLSRLFSGATAAEGRGHPVTAVGDPNQAIYGWRGASVSNIVNFADTFPVRDGLPAAAAAADHQPPLGPVRILEVANRLAAPLYAALPQARPLRPPEGAGPGVVDVAVFETHADELAWLVDAVRDAHDRQWSDIGVLTRDNAHAEPRLRRPHLGRRPGRDRGPLGPAPAARGGRGGGGAAPAARRHRQRLAADAADRAAVGDRAARPAPARRPRRADQPADRRRGGDAGPADAAACDRRRGRPRRAARALRRAGGPR